MLKFVFFIINICLTISLFSQDKIKTKDFFKDLNKEERRVIVFKGTEPAGSGIYNNHFENGVYVRHVIIHFLIQLQNLIQIVDGHHLMMKSMDLSRDMKIIHFL